MSHIRNISIKSHANINQYDPESEHKSLTLHWSASNSEQEHIETFYVYFPGSAKLFLEINNTDDNANSPRLFLEPKEKPWEISLNDLKMTFSNMKDAYNAAKKLYPAISFTILKITIPCDLDETERAVKNLRSYIEEGINFSSHASLEQGEVIANDKYDTTFNLKI
jgi:hypothetical protein